MAILPHTVDMPTGGSFTIYAEPANINYFINGDLEPDASGGVSNGQANVASHSRQRYPGDMAPSGVDGSNREFLIDPSRKSGNGLPGTNFILVALGEEGEILEKRQFTYKGRWLDLHSFLMAEAAFPLFAYNNSGARYTIAAATAA